MSDISADVPDTLLGDPGRLRQVLFNLVGNAVKFTERGEVVLRVRQHESTDEHVTLSFDVSDTGVGVPADKQELIFQDVCAGRRVDNATLRWHWVGSRDRVAADRCDGRTDFTPE